MKAVTRLFFTDMGQFEELKKPFRAALTVALALLVSLAVFIILALLLKASRPLHRSLLRAETANLVRLGFYGLAILQVIIVRVMRGLFFRSPTRDSTDVSPSRKCECPVSGTGAPTPAKDISLGRKSGELPKASGLDVGSAGRRLMLVSIFTSVFSEVPALLGFILFLLAGLTRDLYVLVFVSLVLMFMFFPRLRYWQEWAAEQQSQPPERSRS